MLNSVVFSVSIATTDTAAGQRRHSDGQQMAGQHVQHSQGGMGGIIINNCKACQLIVGQVPTRRA